MPINRAAVYDGALTNFVKHLRIGTNACQAQRLPSQTSSATSTPAAWALSATRPAGRPSR